jgi:deoxyribodipyrimidine photolyase-like uncharacterized protein
MNISSWEDETLPNYPVQVKKVSDGQFKVTSDALKGREWVGESEELAMRSFNDDMSKEHVRLAREETPKWMKDVAEGKDFV